MKILLASNNEDKLREVRAVFGPDFEVLSPGDAGCSLDVVEDGDTFEDNARKKALAFSRAAKILAIADDSGLEVDALDGAPGILSARYAGPEQDSRKNCIKLLDALKDVQKEKRTARFRCVVACAQGDAVIMLADGSVEGRITVEMQGDAGFGYDPVFFYKPYGRTFAECTTDEKNAVSHRGIAFRRAAVRLRELFDPNLHDEDTRRI